MTAPIPGYVLRSRESLPDDAPAYPCAGYSDCDATVERRGGMCVGCSTRLDTARDHAEYDDRIFWS